MAVVITAWFDEGVATFKTGNGVAVMGERCRAIIAAGAPDAALTAFSYMAGYLAAWTDRLAIIGDEIEASL